MIRRDSPFRASLRLLGTRRFGIFWFASLLSNIGTWAQQVAQPWLLLTLGASPFVLGLDAFAMGAPVLLLTLVGGALADRKDRRIVIAGFQSIQMLCPIAIVLLILSGTVQPWMIIVLSLIVGVTDALSMPSFQSIVPLIVGREQIATGIALNSTQFNLSRILGPAIAGVLMLKIGATGAFAISAASYLPFILVAVWILPRGLATIRDSKRLDARTVLVDLQVIGRESTLGGGLLLVLTTSFLCAPIMTFCPLLIRATAHGGVEHFSAAVGAFGVGGLIGATGLLAVDATRDRRRLALCGGIAYAVIVIAATITQSLWAFPVVFGLAGIAMTVSSASANAMLQSLAPESLRGQTVSLFMLAMRGGSSAGSLLTGWSVAVLGVRTALLINGAIALLLLLTLAGPWLRARLPAALGTADGIPKETPRTPRFGI